MRILVIGLLLLLCACSPSNTTLPTLVSLDVEQPTPTIQPTRQLQFWQATEGQLASADVVDTWTFEGERDTQITLRAIAQGADVSLTLFDPSSAILGEGRSIETRLPVSGVYTVEVSGSGEVAYELGLSYTDQPNPSLTPPTPLPVVVGVPTPLPISADLGTFISELNDGQTLAGELTDEENQHVYTYLGKAGEYLSIEAVRVSGELDPLLTLFDGEGMALAVDGNSGRNEGALLRNISLSADGFYTIQVDGKDASGVYSIELNRGDQPAPITPTVITDVTATLYAPALTPTIPPAEAGERLLNHQPVLASLETTSDVQRHSFEATAGEIITVGVIPAAESGLIPRVELYDPDGVPVGAVSGLNNPNQRDAVIPSYVAQLTGPYTAFITAEGETFGAYIIAYGIGSTYRDMMRGEIAADQTLEGTVDQRAVRDVWYARLRQGDVISASLEVTGGVLDPVLELVSDTGELLGIDNNSGGQRRPVLNGVTIPRNGLYYFRVRGAQSDQSGSYRLLWRYLDVAPTVTPPQGLTRVLSVTDNVVENAYQFYPFQGRAGQSLRITVTAEFGSTLDPVLALLDSEANVIAEGDDSDLSLNPQVYVTIPADGTYTVRVNGYLSSGNFDLVVEELIPLN